ncbi:hypothetical protein GGS20DRAFT_561125 [Poronia punctata]|nr:hypothetical protein GGS20DRAFT_561125 [Poronia punctata]
MATQEAPQQILSFLNLVKSLANDPATGWIDQVLEENGSLKTRVEEQKEYSDALVRSTGKLHREIEIKEEEVKLAATKTDEAEAKAKDWENEVTIMTTKLQERDEEIQRNSEKISELETKTAETEKSLKEELEAKDKIIQSHEQSIQQHLDELNKLRDTINTLEESLKSTESQLTTTSSALKEVQDMSYEMVPAEKATIVKELDKIYNAARSLATKYFSEDLSEDVLSNTEGFESLSREFHFPLPASNTDAAKKARVAVLMTDLGSKLASRIFVPFYTLVEPPEEVDDVTILLSCLFPTDPNRELYIRKLLLAIQPESQKKVAIKRARTIAREVYNDIGFLVNTNKRAKFGEDVLKLCGYAVACWENLRPIKSKIEPFLGDDEYDDKFWLPAELQLAEAKKSRANGKSNGIDNSLNTKGSVHSLNQFNQLDCIWPGFYLDGQVLKKGYMLLQSQVRPASEEQPFKRRSRRAQQRVGLQSHRRQSSTFQSLPWPETSSSPEPTPDASTDAES